MLGGTARCWRTRWETVSPSGWQTGWRITWRAGISGQWPPSWDLPSRPGPPAHAGGRRSRAMTSRGLCSWSARLGCSTLLDRSSGPGHGCGSSDRHRRTAGCRPCGSSISSAASHPSSSARPCSPALRTRQLPGWRPAARRAPGHGRPAGHDHDDRNQGVRCERSGCRPARSRNGIAGSGWRRMRIRQAPGAFADLARLWPALAEMSTPEVRDLALARMKTDFAERPVARIPNYLRRTARLPRTWLPALLIMSRPGQPRAPMLHTKSISWSGGSRRR